MFRKEASELYNLLYRSLDHTKSFVSYPKVGDDVLTNFYVYEDIDIYVNNDIISHFTNIKDITFPVSIHLIINNKKVMIVSKCLFDLSNKDIDTFKYLLLSTSLLPLDLILKLKNYCNVNTKTMYEYRKELEYHISNNELKEDIRGQLLFQIMKLDSICYFCIHSDICKTSIIHRKYTENC
jgi:hypothetical protein